MPHSPAGPSILTADLHAAHVQMLDATVEIPQQGVIRSLNAHVSGGIAMYEYTRQLAAQASTS